jgi:hypothetical protein
MMKLILVACLALVATAVPVISLDLSAKYPSTGKCDDMSIVKTKRAGKVSAIVCAAKKDAAGTATDSGNCGLSWTPCFTCTRPPARHGRWADWDQAKAEYGALAHEVGEEVTNVLIGEPQQSSGRFTEAGWLHRPQVDDWAAHQTECHALMP